MKATVSQLQARTWDELRSEAPDWWLWVDTTAPGVHRASELPTPPPQVTHVWGWTESWALRARVDVGLGAEGAVGVRGARLTWTGAPPEGEQQHVDVTTREVPRPVWNRTLGHASMPVVPGLTDDESSRNLVTMEVHIPSDDNGTSRFLPLTFVRA